MKCLCSEKNKEACLLLCSDKETITIELTRHHARAAVVILETQILSRPVLELLLKLQEGLRQ